MSAGSTQFRTFQSPQAYEDALYRHGQHIRWTRGLLCPCVEELSSQPNPQCSLCHGRGYFYRVPGNMEVLQEIVKHDGCGRLYAANIPVINNSISAYHQDTSLVISSLQPSDGSYIQLDAPYPKAWQRIIVNYKFSPLLDIENENSDVVNTNVLKTIATRFVEKGKSFEGSVDEVTKVYNVTRSENYTVNSVAKEYIFLNGMGTWQSGDTLQVSYNYVKPFSFLLMGISQKILYKSTHVLPEADAILVTPYYAHVAPNDLLTALATEQTASCIINPQVLSGNDVVEGYFDLSQLKHVVDVYGNEYIVGTGNDVELQGRNEIKWNITKLTVKYSVMFTYHPTFVAMLPMHTLRNAENKSFANKINLVGFDKLTPKSF